MESSTPVADAVFSFLWRWLWRIAFWGVVAFAGVFALFWIIAWAESNPERWGITVLGGMVGGCFWCLDNLRRSGETLIKQNDQIIRLLRREPPTSYDDF
jgi:hypothetical protein